MPRDPSSSSGTHPDEDDLPDVPRTTELLLKLRRKDGMMSWGTLVPCVIYLGAAVAYLVVSGKDAFPGIILWVGMAALFLVANRMDKQKKREQLVQELLGELVAENNRLRRLVPESSKNVN